ncbi:MAG TPA: spore coat protein CotH [Ruminiclostridium sp.]|nr:spore coat protein CotH [Ruminiclostridium sp.]
MVAAVLATVFAYMNPSVFASITSAAEPAYASAMDKTEIMDIQIAADEKEWANMLENATTEEYISATVIINGKKIKNVGIRPKGNSSLSTVAQDDTTDRFSFKIEFDHYIAEQTWLGLDKLAVNNMQGDATYMKEYLSYDIMDYVGVAAPLYTFADISVNGENWGFYLAVECLEDSYTERVYGKNHGDLYKPESTGMRGNGQMNGFIEGMQNAGKNTEQPQDDPLNLMQTQPQAPAPNGGNQQNIRDNRGGGGGMASSGVSLQYIDDASSSYSAIFDNSVFDTTESDHKRVIEALEKLSKGEDLENTVDIEMVLKYFAAHTVVVNLDSYVSNMGHNYYLYEDDGQLTILPWDYNLAFGGFQSGNASSVVNFPIDTPVSGVSLEDRPLLGKLLEVPEYMELYHSYLQQIVDDYFNSGLFEQTIDSLYVLISSHVEADPTAFYDYDAYNTAVDELKKLGLLRAESIEGQLDGTIPSTSEGQSADSSKLIDASSINLSALGSQGGGMGGADRPVQGGFGGMGGQPPRNAQGGENNFAPGQKAGFGDQQSATASEFDINAWLFIGGYTILLVIGLFFVFFFKRRRDS